MGEQLQQSLTSELATDLARAIEAMTSEQPKLILGKESPPVSGTNTTWRQGFTASSGAVWLVVAASTWKSIGTRALRAAGIEDSDSETSKITFAEILAQALSMLAQSISGRTSNEWNCSECAERAGELPAGLSWTSVHLTFADGESDPVFVAFDEAMLRDLVAVPHTAGAIVSKSALLQPAREKSKTLDLLLDVELPVSVSFGRAQLPLKDVIKLTTGCIVELNRTISEPVEIIVNNCVIARGEVVIVEGNFGVRIQQVVSREERLRTLY